MIINKTRQDGSANLRDKYITEHLKESLRNAARYPKVSELGGIKYILPKIQELIITPVTKQEEYSKFGQDPHRGVILYGVSGVGKTYLAHCIAQEAQLPMIKCGIRDAKEIRECFRKVELIKPALVLMDDIDKLTREDNWGEIDQIQESLESMSKNILVIATANSFTGVDKKLVTFNKFEIQILVKVPNINERLEIIKYLTKDRFCLNCELIAQNTPGSTPADLARLIRSTVTKSIYFGKCVITNEEIEKVISEKKSPGGVTFDDIGALENVKEILKLNVILPSLYPEAYKKMGVLKAAGVLLHGPPGCGKTMLAKAVSNMSHCNFISIRGPELISKYVGDSEKEIRSLFERARALSPCVVFFDEIDSICSKRTSSSFGNRIVNQILTLLDGLENRGLVFVIAATNRLKVLDKALLRPGRFDRVVEVPYPSKEECGKIFKKLVKNIPIEDIDLESLPSGRCSGADIYGIIREAAVNAIRRDLGASPKITRLDIENAILNTKFPH